ncbi:hypothetical protein FOZ62_028849 [Perkinsus olseni]|nr:hypothetical protein FOZ62_028849 [Perkinsus olseni]
MHRTSERYQSDARSLGIMPGSGSFIAWSILNLKLERAYTRHFANTDPELSCDIDERVCIDPRANDKVPPGHLPLRVNVTAGSVPPSNNLAIKSFTIKGGRKSDEEMACRLNRDLRTMPHYVTTENAPDVGNLEETCESFLRFKAWELNQMLSHTPRVRLCLKHAHFGGSQVSLTFLRWRDFDMMRQKREKHLRKGKQSGCVVS